MAIMTLLLMVYLYVCFKSVTYFAKHHREMTSPRKIIIANIIFLCLVFVFAFSAEIIVNEPRNSILKDMWQVVGLLNSLTFIHIIETFKGNPTNGRGN